MSSKKQQEEPEFFNWLVGKGERDWAPFLDEYDMLDFLNEEKKKKKEEEEDDDMFDFLDEEEEEQKNKKKKKKEEEEEEEDDDMFDFLDEEEEQKNKEEDDDEGDDDEEDEEDDEEYQDEVDGVEEVGEAKNKDLEKLCSLKFKNVESAMAYVQSLDKMKMYFKAPKNSTHQRFLCSQGWKRRDGKRSKFDAVLRDNGERVCNFRCLLNYDGQCQEWKFSKQSNFVHTCTNGDKHYRERRDEARQIIVNSNITSLRLPPTSKWRKSLNVKTTTETVADETGVILSYSQARAVVKEKEKKGAFVDVFQFNNLPKVLQKLKEIDPRGVYVYEVKETAYSKNTLTYAFVMFGFVIESLERCGGGDVLSLDAGHLIGQFGGRIWLCTESDADRHDIVVALAFSPSETAEDNARTIALVREYLPGLRVLFTDNGENISSHSSCISFNVFLKDPLKLLTQATRY